MDVDKKEDNYIFSYRYSFFCNAVQPVQPMNQDTIAKMCVVEHLHSCKLESAV